MWWTLFLCSILCLCHWVSHFLTKKSSVADQAAESQFQQRSPAVTTHPHPNHWEGDVMATETRGHSWCSVSVGLATAVSSPVSCGAIGMADVSSVESTEGWLECGIHFFFLSLCFSLSIPLPSPFLLPSFFACHSLSQVRKHITDLYEDLRDGHNLISLLEVLSGVTLVWTFIPLSRSHLHKHMTIVSFIIPAWRWLSAPGWHTIDAKVEQPGVLSPVCQ